MTHYSACPHDCPSTCALEVEKLDDNTIGKVRGASEQSYTAGVICSKVARYSERIHHPDRLTQPLKRTGEKAAVSSRRSVGRMHWMRSPSSCLKLSNATAARLSGPTSMPAPWDWLCVTGSIAFVTSKNIPDRLRFRGPCFGPMIFCYPC